MTDLANRRPIGQKIVIWFFVLCWIIVAGFPFLWTMWGSFKVQGDFFSKADWTYALQGVRTQAETGAAFTGDGYFGAWVTKAFWHAALNTTIVVVSVVIISLSLGTLGGYALARSAKFASLSSEYLLDIRPEGPRASPQVDH